jgi:predicted small lipoprotein YifL
MTLIQRASGPPRTDHRRAVLGLLLATLTVLGGCGRKGDLEPPPKPKASDKGASQ